MKQAILILGLSLSALASQATIVKGNYAGTIRRPNGGTVVICNRSNNNCFSVVVRNNDDSFPAGSWRVTVFGNGEPKNVISEFTSADYFEQNPDNTDDAASDSYLFKTVLSN